MNAIENGGRTPEEIREHYEIEKELASRLRRATREERRHLYRSLYDELFRRLPHHPQLRAKASAGIAAEAAAAQMGLLRRFLRPETVFVEVGPGDCSLSLEVATRVRRVYGVDVSDEITKGLDAPPNFQLILSDGCSIPVPAETVDVVYSNQLMEHLHPEDAREQLQEIYRALRPGGVYVCVTPNRLGGPWDISRHFDAVASGFHLREYTVRELSALFASTGFRQTRVYLGGMGRYRECAVGLAGLAEAGLRAIPYPVRRALLERPPLRILRSIRMAATK